MDSIVYSTDTLAVIASVAIAIVGFSGVVVALTGRTTNTFGEVEMLNFRILLQVSAFALLFALVPLILHRAFEAPQAWRIAMALYGAGHLFDAGFFVVRTWGSTDLSRLQRVAPRAGIAIAAIQLLLVVIAGTTTIEVAYLVVLIWHLAIAGMGFANLVFAFNNVDRE